MSDLNNSGYFEYCSTVSERYVCHETISKLYERVKSIFVNCRNIQIIFRRIQSLADVLDSLHTPYRSEDWLFNVRNVRKCPKRQPKTEDVNMSESIHNDFASEKKNDCSTSVESSPTKIRAQFSDTLIFASFT